MIHLVDANVLSEPTRRTPNSKVVQWLTVHEKSLVVDPIILGEVGIGILSLPNGRKRTHLEQWFADVVQTIECVPWDAAVSRRWAKLVVQLKKKAISRNTPPTICAPLGQISRPIEEERPNDGGAG